jgi:hybrid cluster-associated redox disulfide protein
MKTEKTIKKNVVRKNMTFAEIMEKYPDAANVLFESGLHCIGCGMAMYETIEQGCMAHGMSKKEIDELIKRLNNGVLLEKEPTMVEKRKK